LATGHPLTLNRRLPVFAKPSFRQSLSTACASHARLGPASLVLYDVSTLHFETDAGDGFREPRFSKERRLDPQITLGLLTDAAGFPLSVAAFEGNKAETATMLPVINAFKTAHSLTDVTVVADAGMISEANQVALQAAGLSFILGARIPYLPDVVREWRDKHPDEAIPDGLVLTQPWPSTSPEKARGIPDRVIHYQFRHDRARRTLRGIDEQLAKAQRAVDGHAPVKRNRYIQLTGATKSVNRALETKTRALAGWKGYTTNLAGQPAQFVIDAYHQLWRIEKSFRMSKHDLQARPIYHRPRLDRGAPDRRVRRPGRIALDRAPNQLEHQEIHTHRPPLPYRHNPSRQPHPDRRRTSTARPRRSPRHDPRRRCALV
jgi:Transposase DDE domain